MKALLAKFGFTGIFISGNGIALDQQFLQVVGEDADNTYATFIGPDDPSQWPPEFIKGYQDSYQAQPIPSSASGYDAAMILITAIKSLIKTNPQALRGDVKTARKAVLDKIQHPDQPFKGLTGAITFDCNGDNTATKTFSVYAVEHGQWISKPEYNVTIDG